MLAGNVDADEIGRTFLRLSRRSPAMTPLALAADRVDVLAARLGEPFEALWPALGVAARERLEELEAEAEAGEGPAGTAATHDPDAAGRAGRRVG